MSAAKTPHTPTPYVVNGFGGDYRVVARLEPHGVAISAKGERGDEIETADFIVRACNSHAALVAALERAELLLSGWRTTHEEGRYGNAPINSTRQWLSDVAAISKGERI